MRFRILAIFLVIMTFTYSVPSYSADVSITDAATTIVGEQTIKPSAGVTIKVTATNTAYTAASAHLQGKFKYALTQNDDIKRTNCAADPCTNSEPTNSLTAGTMPW